MRFLFLVITQFTFLLFSLSAHAETAKVITKTNAIREECRFFSPVKAAVQYNDVLEIISQEGDWFKVTYKGIEGCIHKSAIEKKTVDLLGIIGTGGTTSKDEVALAGKGFNPQVEKSYRQKHPGMRFSLVDIIEGYQVPEKKVMEFINDGALRQPE